MTRIGFYAVAVFVLVGLALQNYPLIPVPGVAIGLLGAAAVVVAVRTEHLTLWEKLGWTIVAFLLFGVEVRAIYKDRAKQDSEFASARGEERKQFQHIADGISASLTTTQRSFDVTISSLKGLVGMSREQLAQATGGDSFIVFIPSPYPSGNPPTYPLTIDVIGCYAMRDVSAQIQTHYGSGAANVQREIASIRPLTIPLDILTGVHYTIEKITAGHYGITTWSLNGVIAEDLDLQFVNGALDESIKVQRNGVGKALYFVRHNKYVGPKPPSVPCTAGSQSG